MTTVCTIGFALFTSANVSSITYALLRMPVPTLRRGRTDWRLWRTRRAGWRRCRQPSKVTTTFDTHTCNTYILNLFWFSQPRSSRPSPRAGRWTRPLSPPRPRRTLSVRSPRQPPREQQQPVPHPRPELQLRPRPPGRRPGGRRSRRRRLSPGARAPSRTRRSEGSLRVC